MIIGNVSTCPVCGGNLKHYDKVLRIIRTKGGCIQKIKIRRLKCIMCNKIHRELPLFIIPYKHYIASIIEGVLEGYITPDTIGFEDYPCEVTMMRWWNAKNTYPFMKK